MGVCSGFQNLFCLKSSDIDDLLNIDEFINAILRILSYSNLIRHVGLFVYGRTCRYAYEQTEE